MKKFKAIVFDIDGTLTEDTSWTAFTRDMGGSVADHLAIYGELKGGNIGYEDSKRQLLGLWGNTGNHSRDYITEQIAKWPIKSDAEPLIEKLKADGYILCLITGSVGIYAKYIAERLGVENYYANAELHFDGNGYLIDFDYDIHQSDVKLRQFLEFCKRLRLEPQEVVSVGDSENDIELFKLTGNGVLVGESPSVELSEAAWERIRKLSELTKLLGHI
jgi:HAD superfamily phosphoserine phosphatase-like hydrolase